MAKGFFRLMHIRCTLAWPKCGCTDPATCPHAPTARTLASQREEHARGAPRVARVIERQATRRVRALPADPLPPSTDRGVPRKNNHPFPQGENTPISLHSTSYRRRDAKD